MLTWSLCLIKWALVIIILKNHQQPKRNKHTASGFSSFQCSTDPTKNKLNYYSGKVSKKNISKDLKEYATKIIGYEKKEMTPLTYEKSKSYKAKHLLHMQKKLMLMMIIKDIIK